MPGLGGLAIGFRPVGVHVAVMEVQRYDIAKEIARKALNQQLKDSTGGALYFHDRNVHPDWAKTYRKTAETRHFLFYKPNQALAR